MPRNATTPPVPSSALARTRLECWTLDGEVRLEVADMFPLLANPRSGADRFDHPEHRIDKAGVLVRVSRGGHGVG